LATSCTSKSPADERVERSFYRRAVGYAAVKIFRPDVTPEKADE
jgi:hypothetical protein